MFDKKKSAVYYLGNCVGTIRRIGVGVWERSLGMGMGPESEKLKNKPLAVFNKSNTNK